MLMKVGLSPRLRIRAALRRGEHSGEILGAASELEIDLIILSTRGSTGVARVL